MAAKNTDYSLTEDLKDDDIFEEEETNKEDDDNVENVGSDDEGNESDEDDEPTDIVNDDIDIIDTEEDEEVMFVGEEVLKDSDRISRPFMTKYELVRIIGTRRKQLSLGAKPLIKITGDKKLSINEIVNEEIKAKMIPFKIKRPIPNSNKVEIWKFKELSFEHLFIN